MCCDFRHREENRRKLCQNKSSPPHLFFSFQKFTVTYGHLYSQNSLPMQRIGLVLFQRHNGVQLTKYANADSEGSTVRSICKVQQHEAKPSKDTLDVREKHSLAYVLHTSGTTGLPKIVRVPHKCIVPNILHLR